MNVLATALQCVQCAEPLRVGSLEMFPLLVEDERAPAYLTLDEALAQGWARVTEVSDGGSVPTLRVLNAGAMPILIMDGEELVGAKQNRIVNLTILAPPKSKLDIPVSCVEAGRWGGRTRHFATAPRAHYAAARAQKVMQVNHSIRVHGAHHADQGAIWQDIAEKSMRLGVASTTGAMDAMFEHIEANLRDFDEVLLPVEHQAGAVFAINGVVVGLDLFDAPATWRKLMPKLVHSYGLDALDRRCHPRRGAKPDPEKFLRALSDAKPSMSPAIGLGEDFRLESQHLAGGALALDDRLVHLVAFAV